jgi:hypothetical protein
VARGKFFDWRNRYGKADEHNALVPRDHWIEPEERQAIVDFHDKNPLEGYRRLTFMMLDQDVVAVSPSTTYRVLSAAGRLDRWKQGPSKKGTELFLRPLTKESRASLFAPTRRVVHVNNSVGGWLDIVPADASSRCHKVERFPLGVRRENVREVRFGQVTEEICILVHDEIYPIIRRVADEYHKDHALIMYHVGESRYADDMLSIARQIVDEGARVFVVISRDGD